MIRRSGVSAAVWASNTDGGTEPRSASAHSPSRQAWKFAAAARMASAVISGCPEAPDSPLHSGVPDGADAPGNGAAGATDPVVRPGILNGNQPPAAACAQAGAATTCPANTRTSQSPICASPICASPLGRSQIVDRNNLVMSAAYAGSRNAGSFRKMLPDRELRAPP